MAALLLLPSPAAAAPRTWTWAAIAPEQSVFADVTEAIAARIEKNVQGEVRFKRRFGGVVGDEVSTLDLLRQGRIEVWSGSLGAVVTVVPELRTLELPFRFRDLPGLQAALHRLKRGQIASIQAAFRRRRLVLVTLGAIGWRSFSSAGRPIRTVSDLKGLRARSQDSAVHEAMWRALGAVPKYAPLNELSVTMESERFEVLDVPAAFLYATSVIERIKHCTLTQHMPQLAVVVFSKAAWDGLSRSARAHVTDGLDEVDRRGEAAAEAFEAELLTNMKQRGITVVRPEPAELERFRAATSAVERELAAQAGPEEREIMRQIREAAFAAPAR